MYSREGSHPEVDSDKGGSPSGRHSRVASWEHETRNERPAMQIARSERTTGSIILYGARKRHPGAQDEDSYEEDAVEPEPEPEPSDDSQSPLELGSGSSGT